jgi:hypothetical protein
MWSRRVRVWLSWNVSSRAWVGNEDGFEETLRVPVDGEDRFPIPPLE